MTCSRFYCATSAMREWFLFTEVLAVRKSKNGKKKKRRSGSKRPCCNGNGRNGNGQGSFRSQMLTFYTGRVRAMWECPMCQVMVGQANWNDHLTKRCPKLNGRKHKLFTGSQKNRRAYLNQQIAPAS
jgi:hypothetical protein